MAASPDGLLSAGWWWAVPVSALVAGTLPLRVVRPRPDRLLLPIAGMLAVVGALAMARLEVPLLPNPDVPGDLLWRHLISIALGVATCIAIAIVLRQPVVLRRYKYTWLALTILLLLLTLLFGESIRGARLWFRVGPLQFQPSELLRITLAAWLAGYLDERRDLIAAEMRIGRLRVPPLPYLLPLAIVGMVAIAALLLQNDLGTALLLFGMTLALLFAATGSGAYVMLGAGGFALAAWIAAQVVPRLGIRVQNWADPWRDPLASGYQHVQSEYALASGGLFGAGLGRGTPQVIPDVHTDFVLSAIGEELGLAGTVAVLLLFALLAWRGLAIALALPDGFERLLAVGLAAALGIQTLLIVGGVIRLIPLTGLTLPFVSFGGSAMVSNFAILGLLLALSRQRAAGDRAE